MPANDTPALAPAGESRQPNPEAIAWYVEEAQRLLEDQQRQIESLRTRGGQVAGFDAAVLALIILAEPELWRVHVRSLHMLGDAASNSQQGGDSAARAIEWSLYTFLAGLAFSLLAVATLVIELI